MTIPQALFHELVPQCHQGTNLDCDLLRALAMAYTASISSFPQLAKQMPTSITQQLAGN